jgi:hypothetical protein
MARKLVVSLLAAAALAPGAVVASGCGAEEVAGVDVAQAAQATAKKGTAAYTLTVKSSGLGLPQPLDVKATGVTDLTQPRLSMRMDLASLLATAGVPAGGGPLELRIDGKDVFVRVPELPGLQVPGGKEWVGLDLGQLAESFGLDTAGLGSLVAVDPAAQLRALQQAGALDEVGKEDVGGVQTTHLKGSYTVKQVIAGLPADQRAEAEKALAELRKVPGAGAQLDRPVPVELWVDDQAVVHRVRTSQAVPAQQGVPAGKVDVVYELSDFGAKLDVSRPASVYDATDTLKKFAAQGLPGLQAG